jgi:hypothetical protein
VSNILSISTERETTCILIFAPSSLHTIYVIESYDEVKALIQEAVS